MATTGPIDWNYHVPHIWGRPDAWGAAFFPHENYRAFWGTQWMFQAIPVGSKRTDFDWPIGHLPDAFGSIGGNAGVTLAEVVQLNEVLARSFLDVVGRYPTDDWPRKVGDGSLADGARLDPATLTADEPSLESALAGGYVSDVIASECHSSRYANCYYLKLRVMHDAKALTQPTMSEVAVWMRVIWPNFPWARLTV